MLRTLFSTIASCTYFQKIKKLERSIGYKLIFQNIPATYINGVMSCDMTKTWKEFGLDIERGANYFTMGAVVDGTSSRFRRDAAQYQSWLGGYVVKLATKKAWSFQDHFDLAVADQKSWLARYGDPSPLCTTENAELHSMGKIMIGGYAGYLYEFGCVTHSDVGGGHGTLPLRLAATGMAAMFNLSSPALNIKGTALRPAAAGNRYETITLKGYIAVVNVEDGVNVVLYGNGAIIPDGDLKTDKSPALDTFEILKGDLLTAMKSCEIVKV
jgi:hypothetical protein